MRKVLVGIVVLAVVIAAAYLILGRGRSGQRASQEPGQASPPVKASAEVVAEARVVPVRGVTLSAAVGGTVAHVFVREDEGVKQGQTLVRFEAARQASASVAQAQAQLRRAQARLAELKAGPRPQDVEAAKAALQAAEARHAQVIAGAREQERAQARAMVEQADRRTESVRQRAAQAESALRLAEDDLRRMEQLFAQKAVAQQSVDQARARAEAARADLEAARAEQAVAAAQGASARQQLSLVQVGARKEEIDAAAADVRRARAQLDLLLSGARPETIAAAEADVALASAALKQSMAALDQAEIRAPFDGLVAWVGPKPGEFVPPGTPVVRVGDLSAWQIETTDLTELSIVSVRVGSQARITFDGIPGLELTGKVAQVKAFGENRLGDITYTVTIALDRQDERLRWNMTASVAIEPK